MHDVLLSFVGNRDPLGERSASGDEPEPGPVLSLLGARRFDRVVLFCTGSAYVERARMVQEAVTGDDPEVTFSFVQIELDSPIDYAEIYGKLRSSLDRLLPGMPAGTHRLSILLDPGTPQMQTAWFLLVAGGLLDAELLQGVPPRFAGGAYKVRTVDIASDRFPGITIARSAAGARQTALPEDIVGEPRSATGAYGEEAAQVVGPTWIRSSGTAVIGTGPEFTAVLDQAQRVARYDVSVVIRGETGTGKEVVARLIHESSARAERAFVAINCAAISTSLAESEFFGHEKGAFTGADRPRLGQFRAADGGTIFLDEVGDLPLEIQAKLLRVLEDRTVVPVGSDKPVRVDVRVIAATNRDLAERMDCGAFRRDLYERLAQVTIAIPPLRQRPVDVPLLLRHFVERWNEQYGERKGIGEEALAMLLEYPWPGNVRELANAVASICAMGHSDRIGVELLPTSILRHFERARGVSSAVVPIPAEGLDLRAVLHEVEKSYYEEALRTVDGNAEQAARLLGINGAAFRKAARERLGVRYGE